MTDDEENVERTARSTEDILKRSDHMADEFERLLRESEKLMDQLKGRA